MMDERTLTDLGVIQSALRATSAAEALRHAIRRYAALVRQVDSGKQVQVISNAVGATPLQIDVPNNGARG